MSSELDKVTAALRALASVAFPDGYLAELELAVVNAHLEATKAERAAHLLATRGPDEAAAIMGCGRSQVYVLASCARKSPEKVQKLDDSRTQAA